jgi:predicted transcriptional regulator
MNQFVALKERNLHPMMTQELAEKVTECTKKTIAALDQSACSSIQNDFQICLEQGQRLHHKCAKQYKESLELCTAEHIGQLDA